MLVESLVYYMYAAAIVAVAGTAEAQNNFSQSYAPEYFECPPDVQWIRPASGLSKQETDWVLGRKRVVLGALETYLERLNITGLDLTLYTASLEDQIDLVPTLGLVISGGGSTSAFTGTGALRAMDNRLPEAVEQRTGGLLQCMTYFSGLSGGSWPAVSFPAHNFPTADEIVEYWQPQIARLGANATTNYTETRNQIFGELTAKRQAGFNISVADFLGRAWANEFLPAPNGGLNMTMSGLALQPKFLSYEMPMSILQLTNVIDQDFEFQGLRIPSSNATLFEVTPFEFGAWEGDVKGFTPTQWLGTALENGMPVNNTACVQGFDRASFVMGTSADAFNFWYIEAASNNTLAGFSKRDNLAGDGSASHSNARPTAVRRAESPIGEFASLISAFAQVFDLNLTSMSYSVWPNPFAGLASTGPTIQDKKDLLLIDGSTSGQTDPFWAQLHRNMDFIVAWEGDDESPPYNWVNGTNLYDTFVAANATGLPFPIIPPANTMVNLNYTLKPAFFGCDVSLTTTKTSDSPIVMFLGNAPYSAYTNFTYSQPSVSREQTYEIFENSFNVFTRGNGTVSTDEDWPVCIGCAAIDRSLTRLGLARPPQCEECFASYCWNGTFDNSDPGIIDTTLILEPDVTFAEWNTTNPF